LLLRVAAIGRGAISVVYVLKRSYSQMDRARIDGQYDRNRPFGQYLQPQQQERYTPDLVPHTRRKMQQQRLRRAVKADNRPKAVSFTDYKKDK